MNKYPSRYPPAITAHWQAIGNVLSGEPEVISVLLLGSAARGELAYVELDGRLEVFSDYELLVVSGRRLPALKRQHIADQLTALEREFAQRNPLFHIDVLFRQRRRLGTLPPIVFTHELKANARVLYGEDVRPLLPEVTLANLDLRNTNEILIKRLWAVLLYTPRRLLYGQLTPLEEMVWGYVLCRNALDLTTVLLPHCGVLLPSYGQRVEYLARHHGQLDLAQRFGEEFPAFLSTCLLERQSLRFSQPLPIRYAKIVDYLEAACDFLLARTADPGASLPQQLIAHSHRLFNECPISRGEWANLLRLTIDYAKKRGPPAAARWLRAPRKGLAAAGLLAAHQALIAHQSGQEAEATAQIAESARLLAHIAVTPLPPPLPALAGLPGPAGGRRTWPSAASSPDRPDFADRWLALRRAWGDFWWEFMRLGDPRYRQRFDRVMEWGEDAPQE
mgnify:CR=1 FL=1